LWNCFLSISLTMIKKWKKSLKLEKFKST
jgi:hypothetical protein